VAKQAREVMASDTLSVVADRGYFKSEQILACHDAGITAYVPKPMTSGAKADGRFNNDAFISDVAKNSIDVFQVATDAARSIDRAIAQPTNVDYSRR
jgi:hypothetical protein